MLAQLLVTRPHTLQPLWETGGVFVQVSILIHMACISYSHIVAFDHDAKRFKTLKNMISKAGAKCITVHLADFLEVRSC